MSQVESTYLIGIDGGGTSCRFALAMPGRRVEAVLAGANVHTDLGKALAVLARGLEELADRAGVPVDTLRAVPAYAGLAGVTGGGVSAVVADALPLDYLVVEDDRRCAVVGALGAANGAVAGIGTGSFLARQDTANVSLLGGYGADLGDEASGCWLGKQLLVRMLHCLDGLAEPSDLTARTWDVFESSLGTLLKFGQEAGPADFAKFAPQIVAAANNGDANGVALMHQGAVYIERCLNVLGWQAGEPFCLIGGLAGHYLPFLPMAIADSVAAPRGSALDGAVQLAADLAAPKVRVVS